MEELTTTQGIVALAAAGATLIALIWLVVLSVKLRRLRADQRAVLGEKGKRDLVEHATTLEAAFVELRDWVEETASALEGQTARAEEHLGACVSHTSLLRYDAYGELSGHQSSSMALLDSRRTGVVLSSIVHRDQARVYVKQLFEGESELELSPEEQAAVEAAMAGAPAAATST